MEIGVALEHAGAVIARDAAFVHPVRVGRMSLGDAAAPERWVAAPSADALRIAYDPIRSDVPQPVAALRVDGVSAALRGRLFYRVIAESGSEEGSVVATGLVADGEATSIALPAAAPSLDATASAYAVEVFVDSDGSGSVTFGPDQLLHRFEVRTLLTFNGVRAVDLPGQDGIFTPGVPGRRFGNGWFAAGMAAGFGLGLKEEVVDSRIDMARLGIALGETVWWYIGGSGQPEDRPAGVVFAEAVKDLAATAAAAFADRSGRVLEALMLGLDGDGKPLSDELAEIWQDFGDLYGLLIDYAERELDDDYEAGQFLGRSLFEAISLTSTGGAGAVTKLSKAGKLRKVLATAKPGSALKTAAGSLVNLSNRLNVHNARHGVTPGATAFLTAITRKARKGQALTKLDLLTDLRTVLDSPQVLRQREKLATLPPGAARNRVEAAYRKDLDGVLKAYADAAVEIATDQSGRVRRELLPTYGETTNAFKGLRIGNDIEINHLPPEVALRAFGVIDTSLTRQDLPAFPMPKTAHRRFHRELRERLGLGAENGTSFDNLIQDGLLTPRSYLKESASILRELRQEQQAELISILWNVLGEE